MIETVCYHGFINPWWYMQSTFYWKQNKWNLQILLNSFFNYLITYKLWVAGWPWTVVCIPNYLYFLIFVRVFCRCERRPYFFHNSVLLLLYHIINFCSISYIAYINVFSSFLHYFEPRRYFHLFILLRLTYFSKLWESPLLCNTVKRGCANNFYISGT
jgi:hypothetical protein